MEQNRLNAALAELNEEQRHLAEVRSSYEIVMRSRFHGLRMLWFSLKHFLGFASPDDRYAAWSLTPAPTLAPPARAAVPQPALAPLPTPAAHARLRASLATLARSPEMQGDPLVSVVIPAYNHSGVTARCLQSIADIGFEGTPAEIVLVDDASTDATPQEFAGLPAVTYVRNAVNSGFVRSCNRGAAIARGRYLFFLNNDTAVRPGWIARSVERAESSEKIGVVGSKLIYADGTLQEAGGIIWREGTGWNYGRNDDPADSRYNYVRDVDYCSGAAILVRADLFRSLGGFDERFAPAYYEDVDLCFAARHNGYRVVYEPRSEIVHYEGVTSGTDTSTGVKHFQEVNWPKFKAKWKRELEHHLNGDPQNVPAAARRHRRGPAVLIIDSYVPMHDQDAGSFRLLRVIKMMRDLGCEVTFLGDNYAALQPYTRQLQALGVEVLHHHSGGRSREAALNEVLPLMEVAWICRPNLFEKYEPIVRGNPDVKVIYDTIDIHFLREKRQAELTGSKDDSWRATETREIACAKAADLTLVVSRTERDLLAGYGISSVGVIPTIHEVECANPPKFDERSGLLFIGGYNHTPNVDSARWLVREILPLVRKTLPDITVTLVGSNPPPEVVELESENVRVTGYVPDVEPFFTQSRVFVAPIRFGAGLKGKVGHALGYGLPVVGTTLAVEGFDLQPGREYLLADDAESFADCIVQLYTDPGLWRAMSAASLRAVAPFSSASVRPELQRLLGELTAHPVHATAPR